MELSVMKSLLNLKNDEIIIKNFYFSGCKKRLFGRQKTAQASYYEPRGKVDHQDGC